MMPAVQNDFASFAEKIGLRKEHAEALWAADIHSPHELGSFDVEKLKGVCNSPLLINFIHPILAKYVVHIATAKDPFQKALTIIKKNAPQDDDDDEPMDATGTAADSLDSDAGPTGRRPGVDAEPRRTTFNNSRARVTSTGRSTGVAKSRLGDEDETGGGISINIRGGNFVQPNIMGKGPVTYDNTNTVISTSLGPSGKGHDETSNKKSALDGKLDLSKDYAWISGGEWRGDNLRVQSSTRAFYETQKERNDVYPVRNFGQNRALIINNYEFPESTGIPRRRGAILDAQNMETTLTQLGFQVTCRTNMNKDAILQLLKEFAQSDLNKNADMVAVYIGSHGVRDEQGHDNFLGVDGERIKFKDIKQIFNREGSRYLNEKPKIFFLQFCRSLDDQKDAAAMKSDTSSDAAAFWGGESDPDPDLRLMDFVCAYATLAGNRAYRGSDGSWFVTCLVRVLSERAKDEDLQSMLTMVNNSVSAKEGTYKEETTEERKRALQISEIVHNLRRKIYFYPGMQ